MDIYKVRDSISALKHYNEVVRATFRYTISADDEEIINVLNSIDKHIDSLEEEIEIDKYFK